MELCSDGHEEVCYDGRFCPACQLKDEIKDLENQIGELEDQVAELKEEINGR